MIDMKTCFNRPFSRLSSFEVTASCRRRSHLCCRDGWVSECNNRIPILTQFLPDVSLYYLFIFFQSILEARNLHSVHGWVLSFCDSSGIWYFQYLPWHYGRQQKMIASHNHFRLRDLKQKFSSQKDLYRCYQHIMKEKFWRESFLPFEFANYPLIFEKRQVFCFACETNILEHYLPASLYNF